MTITIRSLTLPLPLARSALAGRAWRWGGWSGDHLGLRTDRCSDQPPLLARPDVSLCAGARGEGEQ